MRDYLLIAVITLCFLAALRQPVIGILAFVCLGFLNPHEMTWGIGRTFPFSQLMALGTLLGYVFWSESSKFPRQREVLLLLALWGMFGISTLFAFLPDRASDPLIHISKILLMVFLCMSIINTEYRLYLLLLIITLSLGFHALKGGLFVIISGGNYTVWGPEGSFLYANNSIGLALAMNVPWLFYLSKIETRSWLRLIMRVMLILSYPAVICTYSRGAWLGLAIVTALIVLKSKYRFPLVTAAGVLAIMTLPLLPQLLPQRVSDRYDDLVNYEEDSSAQSRFWNWEFCKRVGLAHPLTGGGFGFYSFRAYAIYFPEFMERWPGKVWTCHSMWYTIFGEHGFPGFVLWICLIASCYLSLRQIRSYGQYNTEMSWLLHYADMFQSALVAFMIVGTFLDAAYFDMFYYLVAVIIIAKEIMRRASLPSQHPLSQHSENQYALSPKAGSWHGPFDEVDTIEGKIGTGK